LIRIIKDITIILKVILKVMLKVKLNKKLWILIIFSLVVGYITTTGTKSQLIRLIDIFIIGPLMIYLGYTTYLENSSLLGYNYTKLLYLGLIFFGGTTITYNARNYLAQTH
jgi:hypothetical protein